MTTEIQSETETLGEGRVFEEVVEDALPLLRWDAWAFVFDGEVDGAGRLVDMSFTFPSGANFFAL